MAPTFSRKEYEFIASALAAFKPGELRRQPLLCAAAVQANMAWTAGERCAKQEIIDALAAKFSIDNPNFNAELFRAACKWTR